MAESVPPPSSDQTSSPGNSLPARVGLIVGPLAALVIGLGPQWGWTFDADQPQLNAMAAVTMLMAVWWMTEAVPLAATALLPLLMFPLLGIMSGTEVAQQYGHRLIFLFLGGFLVALAVERSGLHRRIALRIVQAMGDGPRPVVLGFMVATALLSMWLSNTATTVMMLPLAMSIIAQAERHAEHPETVHRFAVCLLLAVAYSASIGGVGTLIGTPTNVAMAAFWEKTYGEPAYSFTEWMTIAVPTATVMLIAAWTLLVYVIFPLGKTRFLGGRQMIAAELKSLGPMSSAERRTLLVFATTALLWIFREPGEDWGWGPLLTGRYAPGDETVAILMAIVCFLIPSGKEPGDRLLDWNAIRQVPWEILILFGGGLALASGMKAAGLDRYLGDVLANNLSGMSRLGMVAITAAGMTTLTELTSNMASLQMILPVLSQGAERLQIEPRLLMLPATLAASFAFMLPVATPPNAIVFGSGRLRIADMIRAGIWLNLLGVVVVVGTLMVLGYS
jgi:sodium-dependent dicarboxylate transporter 2/3/5